MLISLSLSVGHSQTTGPMTYCLHAIFSCSFLAYSLQFYLFPASGHSPKNFILFLPFQDVILLHPITQNCKPTQYVGWSTDPLPWTCCDESQAQQRGLVSVISYWGSLAYCCSSVLLYIFTNKYLIPNTKPQPTLQQILQLSAGDTATLKRFKVALLRGTA